MLSRRLDKLLCLVPECRILADVGCDHGYVGTEALKRNIAERVIFADISAKSLSKARANCPDELQDRATFVCQDGLADLQCDCAVIAGMGGMEIISILRKAKNLPYMLVLQPNRNAREVREFVSDSYRITQDSKISDGKYYDMIVACICADPPKLSEMELEFGADNLSHPTEDFVSYLKKEQTKLTNILHSCGDPDVADRLSRVEKALAICMGGQI